jgi:very-short-patch-repair endonuclease
MSTSVAELLHELGGVARYTALSTVVTRAELDAAVAGGLVTKFGRGVYSLPGADEAARVALQLGGAVSHVSAALAHGWAVKTVPDKPHVVVGRGRKLGARADLAHVHRVELGPKDVVDGVTIPPVTLLHCLRSLPQPDALAIADSALREDGCHQMLGRVAEDARGRGAAKVRLIASRATEKAAGPFESCTRHICFGVPGLDVKPQVTIKNGVFSARADLVDTRLRIVIEADSFEWHGDRAALARDCRRYNRMVVGGWMVLRFAYEDVMFHPDYVHEVLVEAVALAELLHKVGFQPSRAA